MTAILTSSTTLEDDSCLVLHAVGWWQYERLLEAFPEQAGLRITYLDGRLTLLSPTRRHDWHEQILGRLIEAVAIGLGVEVEPAGHATYRREDVEGGVEGDATYYFGPHAELMHGPVNVDLSTQPPPDLAVEVEASHRADDSVAVWGRLGVPEVWRVDIRRGTVTFGVRQPDGSYASSPRSASLAPLEPNDILGQLKLAEQFSYTRWLTQLDGWVRGVLLPRRGG